MMSMVEPSDALRRCLRACSPRGSVGQPRLWDWQGAWQGGGLCPLCICILCCLCRVPGSAGSRGDPCLAGCRLCWCTCQRSAGVPAKLTASLSLSLSPCPCPSPVPRLRDWNAEGSFISCLQDLTAGSWQEGVTRRLRPTYTMAAGAQGQEQEQVLAPAVELMRVSSAEDSDWQPQHPTGGWPEEADSHFFGQVRVRATAGAGAMGSPSPATRSAGLTGCLQGQCPSRTIALAPGGASQPSGGPE